VQAAIRPPTFVFFVNEAKLFPETYRRYMEKQLRSDAGFPGTPIRLLWRSRRKMDREGKHPNNMKVILFQYNQGNEMLFYGIGMFSTLNKKDNEHCLQFTSYYYCQLHQKIKLMGWTNNVHQKHLITSSHVSLHTTWKSFQMKGNLL